MRVNGNLVVVGQLKDVKIDRLATDPVSPALSQVWFNTTDSEMKFYDGTTVQIIATGTGALEDYLKLDGTSAMTGALTLNSADQSSGATTDAVSKGHLDAVAATKQDVLTGATSDLTDTNLSNSMATVSDASGKLISATSTTAAEIEFLAGVTSAIQGQIDSKEGSLGYVPLDSAGDTMTGNLAMGGNSITGLPQSVNPTDAVRKADLDAALAGLDFQPDVDDVQVDATLDVTGSVTGDRYVITDAGNLHASFGTIAGIEDGDIVEFDGTDFQVVYDVSVEGAGAIAWNSAGPNWIYYNTSWGAFGGLDALNAGIGLTKNGNTLDINMGAGIAQLPTDEVGIDAKSDGGLFNTIDGTTESTDTAAQLAIKLNGASLALAAAGVSVAVNGITESMLNASIVGNGLQGAAGTSLSVLTAAGSGIVVDGTGVSVDDTEMRTRVLYLDGAEAMTGELTLSSADQSSAANTSAISKGHLDGAISTINTSISDLETKMGGGYFLYEELTTPSATHTVTHNMNQKYVQVSVIDSSDEIVIPESITYTDANNLVVTFSSSELCRIVVTGLKVAV